MRRRRRDIKFVERSASGPAGVGRVKLASGWRIYMTGTRREREGREALSGWATRRERKNGWGVVDREAI